VRTGRSRAKPPTRITRDRRLDFRMPRARARPDHRRTFIEAAPEEPLRARSAARIAAHRSADVQRGRRSRRAGRPTNRTLARSHAWGRVLAPGCARRANIEAMVTDEEARPRTARDEATPFTAKQGQYLAFVYYYTKIHRMPPAESDFQRFFRVTPPVVHRMIKALQAHGFNRPGTWEGALDDASAHARSTAGPGLTSALTSARTWAAPRRLARITDG
jgi:hypothetical protein